MKKIATFFLLAFLVLISLQTHYELNHPVLQGEVWDFGKVNVYATDIVLILALIFSGLAGVFSKKSGLRQLIPLIILCGMLFASSLLNLREFIAWYLLLRFIEGVLLVWILISTNVKTIQLVCAFVVGMALNSAFAIWQFTTQSVPASKWFGLAEHLPNQEGSAILATGFGRFLRAYGTLPYPDIFGLYAAVALLLVFWLFITRYPETKKYSVREQLLWGLLFLAGVFIATGLALSFSRSALLGAAVGICLLAFLALLKKIWRPVISFFAVLAISAGVLAATFPTSYSIGLTRVTATEAHEQRSIQDRHQGFLDAYQLLDAHWWNGIGLGRSGNAIVEQIEPARKAVQANPAANMFLLIAVEGSIFSCLALIAVFVLLLTDVSTRIVESRAHKHLSLGAMGLVLLVSLLVMSFFGNYLPTLPSGIFLLFLVFGFAMRSVGEDE